MKMQADTTNPSVYFKFFRAMVALACAWALPCVAADLHVNPAGGDGIYTTVQDAVTAAANGDTIIVAAGTYDGDVRLTGKDLALHGANQGIAGVSGVRGAESILTGKVHVGGGSNTRKVVLDGFKFSDTVNTTDWRTTLFLNDLKGHEVRNSIFERRATTSNNTGKFGIELVNGLGGVAIEDNLFTGWYYFFGYNRSWKSGIYSNGGQNSNVFRRNVFENCQTAINVDNWVAAYTITDNIFRSTLGTCLTVGGTSSGHFAGLTRNSFGSGTRINLGNVTTAFNLDISGNYWGTSSPNFASSSILSGGSGKYTVSTWYTDSALSNLAANKPLVNLTQAVAYNTIPDVLAALAEGDQIRVASGFTLTSATTPDGADAVATMQTFAAALEAGAVLSANVAGMSENQLSALSAISGSISTVGGGPYVRWIRDGQTLGFFFASLQAAVDTAESGDTLEIAAGTYSGDVNITKPLTLQGAGTTVIGGDVTFGAEGIDLDGVSLSDGKRWIVTPEASIQDGIDAADPGEMVAVRSGSYTGNVDASRKSVALAAGASPGQVVVDGNLILTDDDTLEVELDGATAGSGYDQWVVNGTVTLGGAVLDVVRGFLPMPGTTFTIIDNNGTDAVVGTFEDLGEGAVLDASGVEMSISYVGGDGNDVVLTVLAPSGVFVDGTYSSETPLWGYSAFAEVQDGIDAVAEGGTVHVAAGTYTENLVVEESLTLIGAGAASTIIDGGGKASVLFVFGDIDVEVVGLTFRNGNDVNGAGVYAEALNTTCGLVLDSCIVTGNTASGQGGGIWAFYADVELVRTTVYNNTVTGTGVARRGGGLFAASCSVSMVNCTFSGNSAYNGGGAFINNGDALVEHVTFTLNTAGNIGGGIFSSGSTVTLANSIVVENTATTSPNVQGFAVPASNIATDSPPILLAALADNGGPTPTHRLLPGSPALNTGVAGDVAVDQRGIPRDQGNLPDIGAYEVVYVAHVDDDWTGLGNCAGTGRVWGINSFGTVQPAISAVQPGGTVYVAAGTYADRLNVGKSVTLLGAQAGVNPTAPGARVDPDAESIITETGLSTPNPDVLMEIPLGVDGVVIDGFTLSGEPSSTTVDISAIRCWGNGALVENNVISGYNAVMFKGGNGFTLSSNRIAANKVGFVVQPSAATDVVVSGNRFVPGEALQSDPTGVNLSNVTGAAVSGNTVTGFVVGTAGRALTGSNVSDLTVVGNTFTGNRDGISIFGNSTGIAITDNDLSSNGRFGINIKGADIAISGNHIADCGTAGINVDRHVIDTENVAISRNDLSGSPGGLIVTAAVTDEIDAEGNWWGTATGPTSPSNPGGTGSEVSGLADFIPFYTESTFKNLAPYGLALSASTVVENEAAGTLIGTLSTTDDDVGDTFIYTFVEGEGDDDNASFVIDGSSLKSAVSFDFETQPTLSVRIQTSDGNNGLYLKSFTIEVEDINEAPVLTAIGNREVLEDIELAFVIEATDQDNDELSYTWLNVPVWATALGTSFAGTPREGQDGDYTVTVTVSDGELSDSETFTITVIAVNDPPIVAAALPDLAKQQDFVSMVIDLSPVFSDIEGDELEYSVEVDGVLDASVAGASLTLTSLDGLNGVARVTVTATEKSTVEKHAVGNSFTVTVKPVWNTTKDAFFDTIQAAINDTGTVAGDTIIVAAGTYSGTLTISKGVALRSVAGAAQTTLAGVAAGAVKIEANGVEIRGFTISNPSGLYGIYALDRSNLLVAENIIENIATAVAVPGGAICGIQIYCKNAEVAGIVIQTNVIRTIESKGNKKSANGIWVGDSTGNFDVTGLVVEGNTISNIKASPFDFAANGRGAYGMILNHADASKGYSGRIVAPQIINNTITDLEGVWSHAIGLEGNTPDAVVTGNVIDRITDHKSPADPDAVGVMVEANASAASVTIEGNSFLDVWLGVRNLTAIPVTADSNYWGAAQPNLAERIAGPVEVENFYADEDLTDLRYWAVYVDDDFTDETEGWGINRFATIQQGVNAVSLYGTVSVAAGTYGEHVTVGKTLNLVGAGAATTVVNGGGSGVVVMVTANDVAISGFTVTGSGMSGVAGGIGLVNVTGCSITGNVASGNLFGIAAVGGGGHTISGNLLTTNGIGITLENLAAFGGSKLNGSNGNTISGNTVTGSLEHGINVPENCNNNIVDGNTVAGCGASGIYLWKAHDSIVRNNTASGNDVGIHVFASRNGILTNNTVTSNANGFMVRTGVYGALEPAATNVLISANVIAGNTVSGLDATDNQGHVVLASANYWGTAFGPSGDGYFGTGDSVAGSVAIDSYYTDAALTALHFYDLYVDAAFEPEQLDVNHFQTIQAAYAAANPGDTIHIADGNYTLGSTFTVAKQGLTISGESRSGVVIDATARTSTAYGILICASDVTLERFTLLPASYPGAGFPVKVSNTPNILSNITLREIEISGSFRTPFDFNGVDNLVLEGLVANGAAWGSGIGLTGCVGVTITGSSTSGNAWGGVRVSASPANEANRPSSDVNVDLAVNAFGEIQALYVEDTVSTVNVTGYSYGIVTSIATGYLGPGYTEAQAIAIALQGELLLGVDVTGLFDGSGDAVSFDAELGTAVVYVDDAWIGLPSGTGVQKPGAPDGTYLMIGRNAFATLQGGVNGVDPAGTVRVAAGQYEEDPTVSGKQVSFIGETDVDGNPLPTLTGTLAIDLPGADSGWCISNINFVVRSPAVNHALTLKSVNGLVIGNCTFDGAALFLAGKNGINFTSGGDGNSNVTIQDCLFSNGLYVSVQGYVNGLTVLNSVFDDVKSGINIQGGGNLVVENCDFSVIAQGEDNDTYGIRFASSSGSTANMDISGVSIAVDRNGLVATAGTYHSAVIVRAGASGTLRVNSSRIYGEVVHSSASDLDASRNYWGSPDGPDAGGVSGAGAVTVAPFYTEAGLINLAPHGLALSAATVNENGAVGTVVGTLSTTDEDAGDVFTYALVAGEGDADNASFVIDGDILKTMESFDFETKSSYTVRIRTSDGNGGAYDTFFAISVIDVNDAPELAAIGPKSVDELVELTFTAIGTDVDAGDVLVYSLDADALLLGMEIDPASGEFTWTPTEAQGPGTYSVTITVTDLGGLQDSETVEISVAEVNLAPVLAEIADVAVDEHATLNLQFTATDDDIPVQTLYYSLDPVSVAAGMSVHEVFGAFSWTPAEDQGPSNHTVTVTVADGLLLPGVAPLLSESFEGFELGTQIGGTGGWVCDDAEVVATPESFANYMGGLPLPDSDHSKSLRVGAPLALNMQSATTTTVDLMLQPVLASATPQDIESGTQAAFYFDVAGDLVVYHAKFVAEEWTQVWTTVALNPKVAAGDWVRLTIVSDYTTSVPANPMFQIRLNGVLVTSSEAREMPDIDADPNGTWFVAASGPTVGNGGATQFNALVTLGEFLLDDVVLSTEAPGGAATHSRTFTITVNEVNEAPIGFADEYTVLEGGTLTVDEAEGVLANDTDADLPPNVLTAELIAGPTRGTLTLNADGSFTYVHNGRRPVADSFTYKVFDGLAYSAATTVTINVEPVNDAPYATSTLPDLSLQQDFGTYVVELEGVFADRERDAFALDASVSEGGLVLASVNGTTLTLQSVSEMRGTATVTVTATETATDPALHGTTSFTVTLKPVWNTTQNTYYTTIQAAVDAADEGDEIRAAAGEYAERVVIATAGVTVRGVGATSIVTGTSAAPAAGVTPSVFKVATNNVTITGFTVPVDFSYNHSGVHTSGNCTGLIVSSNAFVAAASAGTAFGYGLRNAIAINPAITVVGVSQHNAGYSNVTVDGNTVGASAGAAFRAGVQMDRCGGSVAGNTILSINHDFISRFASQGEILVGGNTFLGGGAQVGSFNPGAGTVTFEANVFNSAVMQPETGALGTGASLRLIYFAEVASVNNAVVVRDNTFLNHRWGVSVENFKNVTFDGNTFTPKAESTDFVHMTFNTKIIATSNPSTINRFALSGTLVDNVFEQSGVAGGTALAFYNHHSEGAVFGTFTLGTAGEENSFAAGIANVVALDASAGPSSDWTVFGGYAANIPVTTMTPWGVALDLQNNRFDVGSGFELPTAMSVADLLAVEDKVLHRLDNSALGLIRVKADELFVTLATGSIQRGIDAATVGDTVYVGAGNFLANIALDKRIVLAGQGSGSNPASDTIVTAAVPNAPVFRITASGSSEADRLVVKDLRATGAAPSGNNGSGFLIAAPGAHYTFANVASVANGGNGMAVNLLEGGILEDLLLTGCSFTDNTGSGFRVSTTSSIDGMVISGSHFDRNSFGFYNERGTSSASFVRNLRVTDSTFDDNIATVLNYGRGFQVEKLADAVFERVSFSGNQSHGVLFNLKFADYTGITFADCEFNNNLGDGLRLQAQNTGTYAAKPASLAGVSVVNSRATGNSVGVSFNNNITGMTVALSFLEGNTVAGLVNATDAGAVVAEGNWWGDATGPASVNNPGATGAAVYGLVDFSPWLVDGTDDQPLALGFQPVANPDVNYLPTTVEFVTQPGSAALGSELAAQPVIVRVVGENGETATQYNGPVTLALGSNPGIGELAGTLVVDAVAGVAEFNGLTITVDGGSDFTLTATVGLLVAESDAFDILNPAPVLTAISPIWKPAGSAGFELTLDGGSFVGSSVVLWGGTAKIPTAFSASQLKVWVDAADIASTGTVEVEVFSPAAGGGTSATHMFTVTALAVPTQVWVDDDWDGPAKSGTHVWGYDAFATIQAAVNAVAVGGTVNVAAGTYNEDVLLNKAGIAVLGAGADVSTVVGPIGGEAHTFRFASEGIVLDGFTITRAGNTVAEWNLALNSTGVHLQNRSSGTVRNCLITGMRTGIDINASSNLTIRNNDITFNRTGMILRNVTDNLTVVENRIEDNWTVGVLFLDASNGVNSPVQRAADCTFSNNSIFGNWYGDIVDRQTGGLLPAPGENLKNFSGNWLGTATPTVSVENSAEPGYADQIPVAYGGQAFNPGGAPTILGTASDNIDYTPWLAVGTDTDGGAVGFKGDFSALWVDDGSAQTGTSGRIQEAIDLVADDGTVNVAAGAYIEQLVVGKPLNLQGAGQGETIVKAFDAMPATFTTPGPSVNRAVVIIQGTAGVRIADLTVDGDHRGNTNVRFEGIGIRDAGVLVSNVLVRAVRNEPFSGAQHGTGIYGFNDDGVDRMVTVKDCVVVDFQKSGIVLNGVNMQALVCGCEVTGFGATTVTAQNGIQLGSGASGTVCHNVVADCYYLNDSWGASGILGFSAGSVSIVGNTVSGCAGGVRVDNYYGVTGPVVIEGNVLEGNTFNTVWGCQDVTIIGNSFDSSADALWLIDSEGVVAEGNSFKDCNYGVIVYGDSADVVIRENDFGGCEVAIWNGSAYEVVSENNWFGSETGPANAANPGGTGAAVSGNVDFSPWLGDGTDMQPDVIGFQPNLAVFYHRPVELVFATEPEGGMVDAVLPTQPVVWVMDEIGNVATQFNGSVTLTIGVPNPGAPVPGELVGTTTVTVNGGVAAFEGLKILDGSGVGYQLMASSDGLPDATSTAFNVGNHAVSIEQPKFEWTVANEQELLTFTVTAFDDNLPTQDLTFALDPAALAAGMAIEKIEAGLATFTWTPLETQGSGAQYPVTITVTDNGSPVTTAASSFTITVNEVNVAPVMAPIGDQSVDEQALLTFLVTATDQDDPPQTLKFTLTGDVPDGAVIDAETGIFTWTPTEEQGGAAYTFTVVVTDDGANPANLLDSEEITVTVAEVNVAPVLGTIPPMSVNFGETLTFTATATDQDLPAQTLSFSLQDAPAGASIDAVTGAFTWTPTEAQAQVNYSFTVTVTDDGTNEDNLSDSQTVTVGAVTAAQFCPGFRSPSTSMVVSNVFAFGDSLTSLTWTPDLPDGWEMLAVDTLGNGEAAVEDGAVVFSVAPTNSPVNFTYTVKVPGNQDVTQEISAQADFSGLTVEIAPLTIYRYHSADYQRNAAGEFRTIDNLEMFRVLSYWRAGAYALDPASPDGYKTATAIAADTLNNSHSADYNRDGVINSDEMTRVQMYWGAKGYHVNPAGEDGYGVYVEGPGPSRMSSGLRTLGPMGVQVGRMLPAAYNPGQILEVSHQVTTSDDTLGSLLFEFDLPSGWTLLSARAINDATSATLPTETHGGNEVVLMISPLPASITIVASIAVPLTETRECTLGVEARYRTYKVSNTTIADDGPVAMQALDADGDGIADSWASHYAERLGRSLDPDEDLDGDRHTVRQEYLAGTDPLDRQSVLKLYGVLPKADGTTEVSWSSVDGRRYRIERAVGSPSPENFVPVSGILEADSSGSNTFTDDDDQSEARFYRVRLLDGSLQD